MSKFNTFVNNFSGGKVSDKFKGRFDTQIYQNSLEEFKNFWPGKVGGAYKRTGTLAMADLTAVSANIDTGYTQIPFDSGSGLSYIVLLPNRPVTLQNYGSYVFIYENAGSFNQLIGTETVYDSTDITARQVASLPNWSPPSPSSFSGGSWKYVQAGDFLFLTHSSGEQKPLTIARTASGKFDINYYSENQTNAENFPLALRVPFTQPNISNRQFWLTTGSQIQTGSDYFTEEMTGSQMRLDSGGSSTVVVLDTYVSPTAFNVTYLVGSGAVSATDDWRISMWNDEFGWPTSIAIFKENIFWGGTPKKNFDIVWKSRLGQFFHMTSGILDQDSSSDTSGLNYFGDIAVDHPTSFFPASERANAVQWLSGGRKLMVGTTGGEHIVDGFDGTFEDKENSNYGSSNSQVVKAGKDVVFIGSDRKTVRSYRYADENGSWVSDDFSAQAETLFHSDTVGIGASVKQISWNPDTNHLWVMMSDNRVFILAYNPEYGIKGWSELEIAGNPTVIGIANLPNISRTATETFIMTSRSIGGSANIYMEKIGSEYINKSIKPNLIINDPAKYPRFLDFGHTASSDFNGDAAARTEYIGEEFYVLWFGNGVFGYKDGVEVISDGSGGAKLDKSFPVGAFVLYGYKYDAEFKTLPPEAGGEWGTSMGDIKQIDRTLLKLYRTKELSIGSTDAQSGEELPFEDITYDDLYTGNKEVHVSDNPDTYGQIIVRSTTPTPLNVLALIIKGQSYN